MKLFLDSSVPLAASGLERSASWLLFHLAGAPRWDLLTTPYAVSEVANNIRFLGPEAETAWPQLSTQVVTSEGPVVFSAVRRTNFT